MPGATDEVEVELGGGEGEAVDPLGGGAAGEANLRRATALATRSEPELFALDADALLRPRVGREVAWGQTLHVLEAFEEVRPLLSKEYSAERVARVEAALARVKDDALVLAVAELRRSDALAEIEPRDNSLPSRVRRADQMYFAWAEALGGATAAGRKKLDDIRSGRGSRDDAEDVVRLVEFLRPLVVGVQGIDALTPEALDAAEADATLLLDLLGRHEAGGARAAQELVTRAYTVWHRSYMEIVRAGRDLGFEQADSERRFPKPSGAWGRMPVAAANPAATPVATPEPVDA